MRLFQILKLGRYVHGLDSLNQAIRKGFRKIMVFIYAVSTLMVMLMGYCIIVIPTGIVSAELFRGDKKPNFGPVQSSVVCASCAAGAHDIDAQFCKHFGGQLQSLPGAAPSAPAFAPPEH